MEPMRKLEDIVTSLKKTKNMKLVVVCGDDPHTIEAVAKAVKEEIVDATLVGDKNGIEKVCNDFNIDHSIFEIIDVKDRTEAVKKGAELVWDKGEGDIFMKGLVDTPVYMKAIIRKEKEINKNILLSHTTVVESPFYHKLLFLSDVAVIPKPDLSQKVKMIQYTVEIAHFFNIENPKVAILSSIEKINDAVPSTMDGAILSMMNKRKQIKGCTIDGPLAFDLAISEESKKIKKIESEVAGDADVLIFPNIEAGNVCYKTLTNLGNSTIAAVVTGAKYPCILTSRGDSEESKYYSIALAALIARGRKQ